MEAVTRYALEQCKADASSASRVLELMLSNAMRPREELQCAISLTHELLGELIADIDALLKESAE